MPAWATAARSGRTASTSRRPPARCAPRCASSSFPSRGARRWARWCFARHLDGRVAIDWPATLDEAGVEHHAALLAGRTLKTPLEPGIEDESINARRLRDGSAAVAQIVAVEPVFAMGMPTQNMRLELHLDDDGAGRTVSLAREYVPPYAWTLAEVGTRLPVAVDPKRPDRVTVDWPAAAMAAAGSV